jgi:glycosyltransferase involved in cell wall biosynthesis
MRVAINLLTDDPANPSGAHWFWTRVIPEMASRLTDGEEFHLLVSPKSRPTHQGYGPNVHYITFPWSNESPPRRTLTEHTYAPVRLPLSRIDVFSTLMAPIVRSAPSLVVHIKTLHAYTAPQSVRLAARVYRRMSYPRTAKVADAIIINSESLRGEVMNYLDVDPAKLHLIPEAVDHELFRPGDRDEAWDHVRTRHGVSRPFVLFVSSLWPYKNCGGLLRAFAAAKSDLGDRQLVIVGPGRDVEYVGGLRALAQPGADLPRLRAVPGPIRIGRRRRDGSISREGSVQLRRALIDLGVGLWLCDPAAKRYAAGLKARGKRGGIIACALAHRATRIAHALVRDQRPYDPARWA